MLAAQTGLRSPQIRRWVAVCGSLAVAGAAALLAASCGAGNAYVEEPSEYEAESRQAAATAGWGEEQATREQGVSDSGYDRPQAASRPASAAPAPQRASAEYGKKSYAPPQKPQDKASPASGSSAPDRTVKGEKQVQSPMVVYFGYLKLKVRRQIEAFDQITKLAQAAGGYVQSLSGNTVVVRVPATDFDDAMARFASAGEVLDRRVKAVDVTRQFSDIESRLQVAKEARQRLLLLLERVKDTEERLQILEQIKRLTEHIETAESSLATLRNFANFFTITIDVEAIVADQGKVEHRSPFAWVRSLLPHLVTLTKGKSDVKMAMPKGFVLFEEDNVFRAQASDTSLLRIGREDNEPAGDAVFWSAAIHHEMEGRDEELVDQRSAGPLQVRIYRNKDLRPRYYAVGVAVVGKFVYVVEAFLPNDQAWTAHRDAMWQSFATFEAHP